MKNYSFFISLLMVMLLSVGNVWAVDYELVYTLDGTVTTGGNSNYAQDGGGLTQNSIDWSVTGNTTINPWRIGGRNLTNEDRLVYSKTAISDNIAKIEIEHGTINLTVNSMKVEVASNSDFSTVVSELTPSCTQNNTVTITRPDGKDWSNCFYRLTYNVTAKNSNTYVQLKSIKFYKEKSADAPALESITISGDLTNKSYEEGQSIDFSGLTATGNYNDDSYADLTSSVEWSATPALTAGLTSVTVTATLNEISGNKIINGLTVTEHVVTPGTYDIQTHNELWGTSYSGTASGRTTLSGSKNDVSIIINKNTGSNMYVTSSQTRIYSGYTMIFSVPNGYAITALQFTADGSNWQGDHTADVGTMTDNKNWSGEANSVIITVAGTCRMKAVKVTYAVAAPSKAEAGLVYAEADQKKLTKLGDAFTAPTLSNPNNLSGITYASDNTTVAEVAANGAVTIKAAGVAIITASFEGNDDYKAGSASYTIGVTSHAGTETDPYVAADAKIAIDVKGTVENAYATGIVCNIVTTALPAEGYITFFFSADGATSGQQIEAYKCYGLNSAPFEALTDVKTGATVVVTGTLKKYNSTYEFDQNCHLVSYEAPAVQKTHIANTKETAYTVAQAITYAADGVTYDLDDYVYVQGVVYDVKNFSNGAMDIFIKDANAENQFELYKCSGINDGSSTTPFDALTDVQVGDVVIGYGQLMVYNGVYEFKQGNYLVDLDRPEVAVTSVELGATATVKVGNVINLSASVLPANATDQAIEWSIQSGNDKIKLENGTVTGVAEGEAVVRATSHADNTKYAECTITITAADPTYLYYNYEKVTATADITDGEYLIVYEGESVAFNGGLKTLDVASNNIAVDINDGIIVSNTTTDAAAFTIDVTAGTLRAAMGDYIGVTSYSNGLKQNANSATYPSHSFSIDGERNAIVALNNNWEAPMILNYNTGISDKRFRYYKNGSQKKIQLYKKVGTNEAPKSEAGLAWDPAGDIELTVGDNFTAPTLSNPNHIASGEIEIASSNTSLATVTAGVVSLVENATGEATITATFAGNDNYKAAIVSYTITVNSSTPTPAPSGNVVILAEYDSKFYAMTNSLASGALVGVEVEKDGPTIVVSSAEDKEAIQWTAAVSGNNTTLKDANNKYIKGSNGASLSLDDAAYNWKWDSEKSCYISSSYDTRGLFFSSKDNVFKGYALSNLTSNGYAAIEVIEIDPENIVVTSIVNPQLAYNPASDEITIGDAWSAPTLGYANGFDGLDAVTYVSNNESVAAVTNTGVISLAGGIGTAVITASFAGNTNYLGGSATYTIVVNDIPDNCDGTDDFENEMSGNNASSYNSRVTTNNWVAINALWTTINNEQCYFTLNGKTTAVGQIQSPTLSGGIASLKVRYANTNSETNGVSFKVEIKQGEDIVREYTITKKNAEVSKGTVYTETITNINVEGDFLILITNLSPSNNSTKNKDRLSIGKLCWTNYDTTPEPEPEQNYVEARTGLTVGNFYTICMPQNILGVRGATFWNLNNRDENGSMVYFVEAEAPFDAGKPYIFIATATTLEVAYGEENAGSPVANGALRGTFNSMNQNDFDAVSTANSNSLIYMLVNNQLRQVARRTGNSLGANRAYVIYNELQAGEPTPAPGRRVMAMPMNENVATGIDALGSDAQPSKIIVNGQLFIIRDGKAYDATGRQVSKF